MKQRVNRWLGKSPALQALAGKIYRGLRPTLIAERMFGTRIREREWAEKHRKKSGDWGSGEHTGDDDKWVLDYWSSREHPHRAVLIDKIATFAPLTRVLEIGSNCGPNLYLLSRRFPETDLYGIDINAPAIEQGRRLFAAEGTARVHLSVSRADELQQFTDGFFDIVFTDAILIYIGRDKIAGVLREMLRIARKGLVLVERYDFAPEEPTGQRRLGTRYRDLWVRDYGTLIKEMVPGAQVQVSRIASDIWPDRGWQENGAFIEVKLPAKGGGNE